MEINWNTTHMPSQEGKTVIVTGANSGLGLGTAKALARKGAKVIVAARNMDKGQKALAEIKQETPSAQAELMHLDLADLSVVEQFAQNFQTKYQKLDLLINNAGVMIPKERQVTKEGFELQFGTNHIGHFALSGHLFPLLKATPNSRIVTLSSIAAQMGPADIYWDDLQWEKSYKKMAAYCQSKFCNLMFALELDERLKKENSHVVSVAAHPGWTATNLQRYGGLFMQLGNRLVAQKLDMGILPTLRAATAPEVKGGEFYGPTKLGNMRGYPKLNTPNPKALDGDVRKRFWSMSEELSKVSFKLN